jgi:hypothetical protein
MIIDTQNLFSDSQTITVSTNSSNVIDNLGTSSQVAGTVTNPITVFARVVVAFAGGTSLQLSLVSADDTALSVNAVTHFMGAPIPVASLTAGLLALGEHVPPAKLRKYLGLKYAVVGTMTAGSIIAGLTDDLDTAFRTTDFTSNFAVL